jgi:hypothetical protein
VHASEAGLGTIDSPLIALNKQSLTQDIAVENRRMADMIEGPEEDDDDDEPPKKRGSAGGGGPRKKAKR